MQRYFIPPEQFGENEVQITGSDAHHIVRVLRLRPGDRVICTNGVNREALVEITDTGHGVVIGTILEELPMTNEPRVEVWVSQSLPKGDKMDWIVQKCTEMGAARFIPFVSERTIVQYDAKKEAKRVDRWRKIAKEAAEQSQRNRIPDVEPLVFFDELLKRVSKAGIALFCYEKEQSLGLKEALQSLVLPKNPRTILVIVGPEGGFSEEEVLKAQRAGCLPVHLGRRILRTETAALAALSCILYECGEMGG